ncbi:MAG: hypothetical protein CL694_13245 [Chloroflexi bacterium]|nr:hypothetical protein [Chloroflexota bacterium]
MDPITTSVAAGLITHTMVAVAGVLTRRASDVIAQRDELRAVVENNIQVSAILKEELRTVSYDADPRNFRLAAKMRSFLASPEAESLVRQIYAGYLTSSADDHVGSIKSQFMRLSAIHCSVPVDETDQIAGLLFDALVKSCNRALALAIENGVLAAHDARSEFRFRALRDELANLARNVAELTATDNVDITGILEFEGKYRSEVGARHGEITPPHFDSTRRIAIDDLYVASDIIDMSTVRDEHPSKLQVPDCLATLYRGVVLGCRPSAKVGHIWA